MFRETIAPAMLLFIALSVVTGIAYPLLVTGVAQVAMPGRAKGSLIEQAGGAVGSELVGQKFDAPQYFWGRPSSTLPMPNNAAASSGSNLGPTNPVLVKSVRERVESLHAADAANDRPIPIDLVTASGSGLDPHISPAGANCQVPRVARVRELDETTVRQLVARHTEGRSLGVLGEPRVNVLQLNLALDVVQRQAGECKWK